MGSSAVLPHHPATPLLPPSSRLAQDCHGPQQQPRSDPRAAGLARLPKLPPALSLKFGVTTLTAGGLRAPSSRTCAWDPPALIPVGNAWFVRASGTKWMMYPSSAYNVDE